MTVNENTSCTTATIKKMLLSAHKNKNKRSTIFYKYEAIQICELKITGQNEKVSEIYVLWRF